MRDDEKTLALHGVYNTLYNAATRPDFKFVVTRYFIDEWLPLLGPSLAWLVVGLRQHCFWNRRQNWCIVDKATLSRDTALNERTIERCLKKPFSRWFVIDITHRYRYRTDLGKKVRDKNRYQLLLDDPLSPRHQLGLVELLRQVGSTEADPLDAALATMQSLLELSNLTNGQALTDKISHTDTNSISKNLAHRPILALVEDHWHFNLAAYASDERVVQLNQCCDQLYNHIVQPNKIHVGWQYFRQQWAPLLGHALAWLIIYLRRHCYWDEQTGELRDTISFYKKDLAAALGQTTRNLANLGDNPHTALFFTTTEAPGTRNKPTHYQVRMVDEPLTPADQERVAAELRQRLDGGSYHSDPESGQLNFFSFLDNSPNRQNFAYGSLLGAVSEKMPFRYRKKSRLGDVVSEKMPQHAAASIGKNAATINDSIIPSEKEKILEQQIQTAASPAAPASIDNGLQTILSDLDIQEPTRSKLLANPNLNVTMVGAWFLYAETQPGLNDPRRYVIKRLLANDPPPPEFLAFAQLDDPTWQLFEKIAYCLRTGQAPVAQITPELLDTFVSWTNVYGGLDPAETRFLLAHPIPAPQPKEPDGQNEAARSLWQATLEQLQMQMTQATFDTWLKQTEVLDYDENIFIIAAKNAQAKDWLENRLAQTIERTLTNVVGQPTQVRFALLE